MTFELRVRRLESDGNRFQVDAARGDGARASEIFELTDQTNSRLLELQHSVEEYGLLLADLVLNGKVRELFVAAYGSCAADGSVLRMTLVIDDNASDLHRFEWERLHVSIAGRTVALTCSPNLPFSRYTSLSIADPEPVTERPIRVLIAVANPAELPPGLVAIDVENEIRSLREALRDVPDIGISIMPGRTALSPEYQAELTSAGLRIIGKATTAERLAEQIVLLRAHVVHFLGHGFFRNGVSALFLEDENTGKAVPVKDEVLVPTLKNLHPLPQLVFLAACESATRSETDAHPFVGLGPKLVEAGFPAVVAMQAKVPVALATRLTALFYRDLLATGIVDVALNRSRALLYNAQHSDWAIPVLFSRLRGGRLFRADPVRLTLKAIADSPAFSTSGDVFERPLPLQLVVLEGSTITENWEAVVQESQSHIDLRKGLYGALESPAPGVRIALVGTRGSFKTGVCRRLVRDTATMSLNEGRETVLPVYVDLTRYPAVQSRLLEVSTLEGLIQESLDLYAGAGCEQTDLRNLLAGKAIRLLFVFDNGDDLPHQDRSELIEAILQFALRHRQHQFVFAMEVGCWNPMRFQPSQLMFLRPLSQTRIERLLKSVNTQWAKELNERLVGSGLFDLASLPWLLIRMASEAKRGNLPACRSHVLGGLIDREIRAIPLERGQQSRAFQSLTALARQMHMRRQRQVGVREAFRIFAEVRENREYNLEELLDRFIARGVLKRTWGETIAFTYPAYQAYCCAADLRDRPNQSEWETVVASIGQPFILQWWEDSLILSSGMLEERDAKVRLIESLLGTGSLRVSDRVFLAARCLVESGLATETGGVAGEIFDAVAWRTSAANERDPWKRLRAVRTMGQFRNPVVVPYLARIAVEKVRPAWDGKSDYEYGQVRQAAGRALRRLLPFFPDAIQTAGHDLATLLKLWYDDEHSRLTDILDEKDAAIRDPAYRGLAAFALADLPQKYDEGEKTLVRSFFVPRDVDTLWAITDALILLDPEFVRENAVLPFLDESRGLAEQHPAVWTSREKWNSPLVYIIGQMYMADPLSRRFVESFLKNSQSGVGIQGRALAALGSMSAVDWLDDLADIARGKIDSVAGAENRSDSERDYLRRKALEALGRIGNREILDRLRAERATWTPEFERTFQAVSEQIQLRARGIPVRL